MSNLAMGRSRLCVAAIALLFSVAVTSGDRVSATEAAGGTACGDGLVSASGSQPVGTGPCPGVRPGAIVRSPLGPCTFNFLFVGSDGHRYMGTAGHCVLSSEGETSYLPGKGPIALDGEDKRVGEFAYAVLGDPKDFALIRLDPDVKAKAGMCHFGGPTGINEDSTAGPVVLHHSGNGTGIGEVLPARTAVARSLDDPDEVLATGFAIWGDSGSGVISDDGRAVGVVSAFGMNGIEITRLAPQLKRAEKMLKVDLTLQKAALN